MDIIVPTALVYAPPETPSTDTERLLDGLDRAARAYALRGTLHPWRREELLSALKYLIEAVEDDAGEPCVARVVLERQTYH